MNAMPKTILEDLYFSVSHLLPSCSNQESMVTPHYLYLWHKDRHVVEWNRIESADISPHIYGQLIFNEGAKATQWGKK